MLDIYSFDDDSTNFQENYPIFILDNQADVDLPLHWHLPFEIIMPIHNTFIVECNKTTFEVYIHHIQRQEINKQF